MALRGAVFVPWGCKFPVWHEMWEPMWAAAEEADLVISFHVFEGGGATVGYEIQGVKAMAGIAPDNVMWGSDYPHRDGTWPFSQKAIEEQFRGIDEGVKRKMLRDNVRRVYRITP